MNRTASFIILLLLALLGVGVIWLASAPLTPAQEKVERTIPNDHIPR